MGIEINNRSHNTFPAAAQLPVEHFFKELFLDRQLLPLQETSCHLHQRGIPVRCLQNKWVDRNKKGRQPATHLHVFQRVAPFPSLIRAGLGQMVRYQPGGGRNE